MPKRVIPHRRQSALKELKDALKNRVRSIMWVVGIVTGLAAGVTAVAKAWPYIEPGVLAHRGYVRDVSDSVRKEWLSAIQQLLAVQRDSQIEQAEGKRAATLNDQAKWMLERGKTKDPASLALIDKQLSDIDGSIRKLDAQLRTLNSARAQER